MATAPGTARTGPQSKKGLVIGLAVAGLAVAAGVIAFVVLKGGENGGASGGSRESVIRATLAALGDGDIDKLLALADAKGVYAKAIDCTGKTPAVGTDTDDAKELSPSEKEEQDPSFIHEKYKKEYGELAGRAKGAKIELVEVVTKAPAPHVPKKEGEPGPANATEDDRLFVLEKGQRAMKGCVAKVPMRMQQVKLKVKVAADGQPAAEQDVQMMMMELEGGWYLITPPPISKVFGPAAISAMFTSARDQVCACKDIACAERLKSEFKAKAKEIGLKQEFKKLSEDDQDKLEKVEEEIKACERRLEEGGPAIAASGTPAAGGNDIGARALAKLTVYKDQICACRDKACMDRGSEEMTAWAKAQPDDGMTDDVTRQATAIGEEIGKCMVRITSADGSTPVDKPAEKPLATASDADFPQSPTMPASCETYRQSIARLASCANYPASARQALIDAWKQMISSFGDFSKLPVETQKSIGKTCEQATEAMVKATVSLKC